MKSHANANRDKGNITQVGMWWWQILGRAAGPWPRMASKGGLRARHAAPPALLRLLLLLLLSCVLWLSACHDGGGVHAQLGVATGNLCAMLANCNGHGRCNTATKTCTCYEGYGAPTDVARYHAPDCSKRVCPSGPSWASLPQSATAAHAVAECSDAGICEGASGQCRCFFGYEGNACQRLTCPNSCSGHGVCMSMREMAAMTNALPLSTATTYTSAEATTTWDQDRLFGCVCESSWAVGLALGETQQAEWFGPDCSQRRCPSGNDPMTAADETDCAGVQAAGSTAVGDPGNLCHVECANRGICDYSSGECNCFPGFYGSNCASLSPVT